MSSVCILLSSYNGEKYLKEQLDSLLSQIGVNVMILVRDDGSSDGTIEILKKYQFHKKLKWYGGENIGTARSFLDLMKRAPECEYYAFCDQDDYWEPQKLLRGVEKLSCVKDNIPTLYYSRTKAVNEKLEPLKISKKNILDKTCGKLDFLTTFITHNAAGCTMIFNNVLRKVVNGYTPEIIGMHDSWIYKVCLALNGYIYYDDDSYILYRQHDKNVLGKDKSFFKKWQRRIKMLSKNAGYKSKVAGEIYKKYGVSMTDEQKNILELLINYNSSVRTKLTIIFDRKFKIPWKNYNVMFKLSILFGVF